MKHVIVVGYWFYPENSPRSFHTQGLINGLIDSGFEVDLVLPHVDKQEEFSMNTDTNKLRIHSVKPGYFLHKRKYRRDVNQPLLSKDIKKFRLFKSLYNKLIWPDRTVEFSISAIRFIKSNKLNTNETNIITVGLPVSPHLVGAYFKKRNQSIKWIADYGDPYTFNPTKTKDIKKNIFFEKKLLKSVDKIVIPTVKATMSFKKLGVPEKKIEVIHQLFMNNPEDFRYDRINENKFNILYAGAFYKDIRSPKEFLLGYTKAFKSYNNLSLHFFGNQSAIDEYLDELSIVKQQFNIYTNDYLERSKLLSVMGRANLLININNKSEEQVPSKIIDYIYTEVPVLNIGNKLFDEFINTKNDCTEISLKILELIEKSFKVDYSDLADEYSYFNNLDRYLTLLKEESK